MRQNGCQRHVAWSLVVGMVFWGCNIVVARAADSGIDYQIQDDLTVIGSEGTLADPDVEVRGLSRFDKAIYTGDLLASPYGGLGRYENLLKYSEELTQTGSWTRTGLDATTPVAVDATGPTGVANSAVTLKNGAAANGTLAQVVTTTVTLPYTLSGWAKAGTSTTAQLELTTNGTGATTDTQALTLTSSWQRVSLTKSTGAGTSPTTLTATLKNTGAAGTTILLWGVQLEQAVSPGVYAKTTGSAMTAGRGLVATSGGLLFPDGSSQTTAVQTTSAFLPDTGGSLTTGLLSYWKLDEGGGTSVRDAVSVNDGTATNGPTWTTSGKLGKALSFDGTNDYVSLSPSSFPSGATPRTVSVWLKTATVADQLIFSYGTVANTQEWQLFVGTGTGCGVEGGGNALGTITLGTSGAGNGVCGVQTVTDNVWHHVVGVYDGTTIKIYIDGVLKNSGPRTSNLGLSYATIGGGYPNAPGYYFNGTIDEVSLWSKALSAAEITDLYNAGAGNAYRTSTAIGGWTDDGTVVRLSTGSDAVGIGTTSPAATALLDLTSTTKGLLAPRMTTTQRDAITSPAAGLLLYNTTTNAYNVYNGTSWGAVGGGSGDVLTTGTNTFTATTASPIKIKPSSAPTADTKLFDMQATGAGTTNFSVDAEGDLVANSLDLTTPLPDAEVADNITASSYLPLAGGTLTGNLVIPNAGTLGQAAGPLLTFDDTNNELEITGGNVGIGTASPVSLLALQSTAPFITGRGDSTSGGYPALRGQRSGGTLASPTAVTNIALLGLEGYGYDGSAFQPGAALYITSSQTWSSTARGSYLQFYTVDDNSTTQSERMRITQSGNVGLGTTSPGKLLHVVGSSGVQVGRSPTDAATAPTGVAFTESYLHLGQQEFGANSYRLLSFGYRGTQTNVPAYLGFLETDATAATKGALVFGTRNVTTDTAPTERMRIDTAGNVGIGTASPAQKLSVAGTVESTSGGFKFPDGGVQDTAVTSVPGFKPDTSGALTKSLLSYWRFDEGSGTVVGDAKGSTDGTATNGPTIVAGKVGNARSFDGVDDYVNVGSIGIANDGVMTLSTFVYRSGSGSGSLMAHDPNTTAETDKFFADLSINNRDGGVGVGAVTFTVGKINSGHVAYYTDTAALPANQWTHLTVVYTGGMGSGSGKIYVNGQLYSTLFASSGIVSGTTAYDSWKMGKSVNGLIDEVGIWSRALTASEVTDLYNAGSANQYKPGATIGGWVDDGTIVRLSTGSDAVGIGTTSPAATALLDLTSTTKGLLAPRMTTTQRDAITSPAAGLLLYNTTTNAYNVYNGTSWGAVGSGGGSGDVLMTGTNTFTATTASPIKIKPSSAPTADTKLLDLQATGAGTTTFSVDAEGDVVANSLDLTVALPDAELAQIATAGKISGAALTSLASVPAGAGVLPAANTPLGAAIDSTEITDGTIATADVADSAVTSVKIADGAITWAKLNGTTNLTLDANAADLARTLTITNAAADTATAGTPDLTLIVKGGVAQGATTELLEVQNSAAASLFAVEAGGNVGIGTASPAQKLHVEGQCVTGDTLLPILKKADGRRQKAEDEWVVETVAIKDVQAGMLVYSLNEATGTLEPHRINGLLDMGVQPVFRLTTASGRFIRTTGNHPYLVKVTGEGSGVRGEWRKVVALAVGEAIAVPKTINGRVFLSAVDDAQRRQTQQRQSESPRPQRSFPLAPPPSARVQDNAREDQRNAQDAQGNSPDEWKLLEEVTRQAYQDDALAQVSDRLGNKLNLRVLSWLHLSSVLHLIESLSRPLGTSLVYADVMPPATWQPGAATSAATSQPPTPSSDIVWDPIVLIEPVGREPVYDIEVDGTHNFVANGIIAHNTYLNGNVGIGTATPAQKLSVVGTVESTSGGFKFPDASVQDTAVTSVPGFKPDTSGALATNLSNYWNLNESSGTVATDAKGSNDSTVTNGPTWVAGKLGNALSFDGVNDFVDVAPSALTNFTLTAWIKPSANSGANQGILDGELCGQVDDMGLRMTTTGKLEFQHGDTSATAQFDSTATLALNTWTHVAAVRNTSAGNTRLYINGVLDSTFTNVHSRSLGGANPTCDPYPNRWAIGHLYRGVQLGNTGFTGLIDEVGVWSRALIAAEITDLYNAGAGNAYKRGATIGGWTDDGMVVRLSTGSDAVGIGTTSPAATALLDLTSTTKGLLAPRMTTTQRDAITSPAAGLLLYNTTTNAYNVYNGTSWGAVGGGSGDVLTTGTNTFTATTASPIKIKPSAAPTADTKLLDMQATGAGTTNFSVDAEGDVLATSLDLTTPLPDAEVADNITASSYLPLAGGTLTGNLVIPNAGTLGQAAGPLLTFDDTNNELEITGGNVGIGTASPANLLEVAKNQAATTAMVIRNTNVSGYSQLSVLNDSGLGGGFGVGGSSTTTGVWGNRVYMATDSTSILGLSFIAGLSTGDIRLFTGGSATSNERMRIDSAGNVGIGTTSPAAKLHIAGGAAAVDAGQKLSLEGAASSGDTYATYEAVTGKLWLYVDGEQVAWLKN